MYALNLVPNFGLALRLLGNVRFDQLFHHVRNNLERDFFFDENIDGTKPIIPTTLCLEPSYECSRECVGCYALERKSLGNMPEELANSCAETAYKIGSNYVTILGGEPFMPKVQNLVLGLVKAHPKLSFVACTNGDPINSRLVKEFVRYPNLTMFVSVDGLEEKNDARRGSESYKTATRALDLLHSERLLFGYLSVITPDNWQEVTGEKFVDEMISHGVIVGNYTMIISEGASGTLNSEQYGDAITNLRKFARTKPVYILSADYGNLASKNIIPKVKRSVALSIDPQGGVRVERGGVVFDKISKDNKLEQIIFSEKCQRLLRNKLKCLGEDVRYSVIRETVVS